MSTEILSGGLELLTRLEPEWRYLCEHGEYDQPFHRPELIRAYVEAFEPHSPLMLLTVRISGRLIALMPLVRENALVAGIPARKLRAAGNVHTCRYDLVHAPGMADVAVDAIWRALKDSSGWDMLELSSVPATGALNRLVRRARTDGFPAHAVRSASSPYVALSTGDGAFQSMLERLDSKFRANLRRRMRKLQARGSVRLVRTAAADDRLTRFYELENAGWKGQGRTAILQDTRTLHYYDVLAREGERYGYLSLYSLECAGEPVAMHYGLTHRGRYFVLKTAYEQSFGEYSPGQLLTFEVLRDIAARHCTEFDFLGVPMDWKRDWAPRLRPHADWYVFRGAMGAALHLVHARARRATGRSLRRWKAAMRQMTAAPRGRAR